MPRYQFDPMRLRLRQPAWWQLALLAAVAIAIILAIAIVATSPILVIAPVVLVALLAQRFLARRAARRGGPSPGTRYEVVDAEYEVISAADRPERGDGDQRRE